MVFAPSDRGQFAKPNFVIAKSKARSVADVWVVALVLRTGQPEAEALSLGTPRSRLLPLLLAKTMEEVVPQDPAGLGWPGRLQQPWLRQQRWAGEQVCGQGPRSEEARAERADRATPHQAVLWAQGQLREDPRPHSSEAASP